MMQRDDDKNVSGAEYENAMLGDDLIDALRGERENLYGRIEDGQAGVNELRCRLKIVTHELLKAEVAR